MGLVFQRAAGQTVETAAVHTRRPCLPRPGRDRRGRRGTGPSRLGPQPQRRLAGRLAFHHRVNCNPEGPQGSARGGDRSLRAANLGGCAGRNSRPPPVRDPPAPRKPGIRSPLNHRKPGVSAPLAASPGVPPPHTAHCKLGVTAPHPANPGFPPSRLARDLPPPPGHPKPDNLCLCPRPLQTRDPFLPPPAPASLGPLPSRRPSHARETPDPNCPRRGPNSSLNPRTCGGGGTQVGVYHALHRSQARGEAGPHQVLPLLLAARFAVTKPPGTAESRRRPPWASCEREDLGLS